MNLFLKFIREKNVGLFHLTGRFNLIKNWKVISKVWIYLINCQFDCDDDDEGS